MSTNDPVRLAGDSAATDFDAFKRAFDAEAFHRQLGLTLVERGDGTVRIRLSIRKETPRGIGGSVHGGVLATMVDAASLVAAFTKLRPGQLPAGTADLAITYLRQAHGDEIHADARVLRHGRQLSVIEVDITDAEQTLCARGRVLYAFRSNP